MHTYHKKLLLTTDEMVHDQLKKKKQREAFQRDKDAGSVIEFSFYNAIQKACSILTAWHIFVYEWGEKIIKI